MELTIDDIADVKTPVTDEKSALNKRIFDLRNEVIFLRGKLLMPNSARGALAGGGLGYLFGKSMVFAALGAFAGFKLGQSKELNETDRQVIKNMLAQKSQELRLLLAQARGETINAQTGVVGSTDLAEAEFSGIRFDEPFNSFMGEPSKNFHGIVFGRPKQGKSIFCMNFAGYFSRRHGNVLYVASEEGFGKTLQKKLHDFGGANKRLELGNFKEFEQIRQALKKKMYDLVFIDSVNYIRITPEQIEAMKKENPNTAFVTVLQATKNGDFRGSQEFAHNCDIVIEVDAGIAKQTGRFAPEAYIQIFPEAAAQAQAPAHPGNDLELSDLNF